MIALGVLQRQGGASLGFLQFMAIGVPLSLSLLAVTLAAVRWLVPRPAVGRPT